VVTWKWLLEIGHFLMIPKGDSEQAHQPRLPPAHASWQGQCYEQETLLSTRGILGMNDRAIKHAFRAFSNRYLQNCVSFLVRRL